MSHQSCEKKETVNKWEYEVCNIAKFMLVNNLNDPICQGLDGSNHLKPRSKTGMNSRAHPPPQYVLDFVGFYEILAKYKENRHLVVQVIVTGFPRSPDCERRFPDLSCHFLSNFQYFLVFWSLY